MGHEEDRWGGERIRAWLNILRNGSTREGMQIYARATHIQDFYMQFLEQDYVFWSEYRVIDRNCILRLKYK